MNFLRGLLRLITILAIESIVLSVFVLILNKLFLKPDDEFEIIGLIYLPLFFLWFKVVLELWILLVLFRPAEIKSKMNTEKYFRYRGIITILITIILIGLAIDDARGFDIFVVMPIIYPVCIYLSFLLYREKILNPWIK